MEKDNRFSMIAIGVVIGLVVTICILAASYFFVFKDKTGESAPTATAFTPIVTLVTATIPEVQLPVVTTPAPTPTSEYPTISAKVATNCRKGPNTNYEIVGLLKENQKSEVHGRNSDNTWWYIRNPDDPQGFCWVWGETTQVTGDTGTIPIATPQNPPPQNPDILFYASFSNKHQCMGTMGFFFQITNAGTMPLKSMQITILDLTAQENLMGPAEQNMPFMLDANQCPPTTNILDPGTTAFVGGMLDKDPLSNHDARAIIKLCTEESLKGTCLEQYVTFKTP